MELTIFDLLERWQPFEEKEPEKDYEFSFLIPVQPITKEFEVFKKWCRACSITLVKHEASDKLGIRIFKGVRVSLTLK